MPTHTKAVLIRPDGQSFGSLSQLNRSGLSQFEVLP